MNRRITYIFFLIVLTSSCASLPEYAVHLYPDAELSAEESAFVFVTHPIVPVEVDGSPLPGFLIKRYHRTADLIQVPAGRHTITVTDEDILGHEHSLSRKTQPRFSLPLSSWFEPGWLYFVRLRHPLMYPQTLTAIIEKGGKQTITSPDGERSITFHVLPHPRPEKVSYGFRVQAGQQTRDYLVIDDGPCFSPDRKRLAFAATGKKNTVVVLDGREIASYDEVKDLLFSPDSQHLAFRARVGKQWVSVVDGNPGQAYDDISHLRFSPNSQRVAFCARRGKQWTVVVDGKASGWYHDVKIPIFSPNSQHLAFGARSGKEWMVVIDGKTGEAYNHIFLPRFSPDSRRIAYGVQSGKTWSLVVEEHAGTPGERSSQSVSGLHEILQNAQHHARQFALFMMNNGVVPQEKNVPLQFSFEDRAYQHRLNLDLDRLKSYNMSFLPVFSPDSQRVTYRALTVDHLRRQRSNLKSSSLKVFAREFLLYYLEDQ